MWTPTDDDVARVAAALVADVVRDRGAWWLDDAGNDAVAAVLDSGDEATRLDRLLDLLDERVTVVGVRRWLEGRIRAHPSAA